MSELEKKEADHRESTLLFVVGAILIFLGFVFPGWLWLLLTPGHAGNLSLSIGFLAGVAGVVFMIVAFFKRFREGKSDTGN